MVNPLKYYFPLKQADCISPQRKGLGLKRHMISLHCVVISYSKEYIKKNKNDLSNWIQEQSKGSHWTDMGQVELQ